MRSLGIDPARTKTGLAVVDVREFQPHLLHSETVKYRQGETMRASRDRIAGRALELFDQYRCEMVGMECAVVGVKDGSNPRTFEQLLHDKARNLRSLQVQARIAGAIEDRLELRELLVVPFENAAHWRQRVGIVVGPRITRDQLKAAAIERCRRLFERDLPDDEAEAALAGWAATMMVEVECDGKHDDTPF